MIWVLLGLLGVPIWLIVGALLSVVYSRRSFRTQDEVFDLSIRRPGDEKWPRQPAHGRCFRGIIVVNKGLALIRTEIHEVDDIAVLELDPPPRKPADAVGRLVTLRDGSSIEVALADADASRLDVLVLQ